MATSGKVTAKVRARIEHWAAFGLGRDAIASKLAAEGHQVTGRTVSRALADKGATAASDTATVPRAKAKRGSLAARGEAVAETVAAELSEDAEAMADVLVALRGRHAEVRGIADELAPLSKEGGRNAAVYCQLVRLEGDLAARVRELTPPEKPDPSTDPANLLAKQLLIATIEGLVARPTEEP